MPSYRDLKAWQHAMKLAVECAKAAKRWGSLSEVQSALEVARELGYCPDDDYRRIDAIATETGKTLWGLLRKINRAASPSPSTT